MIYYYYFDTHIRIEKFVVVVVAVVVVFHARIQQILSEVVQI